MIAYTNFNFYMNRCGSAHRVGDVAALWTTGRERGAMSERRSTQVERVGLLVYLKVQYVILEPRSLSLAVLHIDTVEVKRGQLNSSCASVRAET